MELTVCEKQERKIARDNAEREARKADMKQHADKLFQGFKKLNDSHAKRAIWELFQNAIDISDGNCEIEIELNPDEIIFKHNGKAFTSRTLIALIKQVSSKDANSNKKEVGQYGTGFITTHTLGRKIILNGSLEDNGNYISLDDFEIDRTAELANDLIDKLATQERNVLDLIENGVYKTVSEVQTSFAYQTFSDLERNRAKKALETLMTIIPYVLTLNETLQKVKVSSFCDDFEDLLYVKGETQSDDDLVYKTTILENGRNNDIYYLGNEGKDTIVLLPINSNNEAIKFSDDLPRLFLYYPLIGSEDFGFNFIIHSNKFFPTEPRDGVYLSSDNEQVSLDEESNVAILNEASNMIFSYLENNISNITNSINIASLDFKIDSDNSYLNDYFESFKNEWVNSFIDLSIVDTKEGKFSPRDVFFFSEELLRSEECTECIYKLIDRFDWELNIPKINNVSEWTDIVVNWNSSDIKFIGVKDLLKKIEEVGDLSSFENEYDLKCLYKYLFDNDFESEFSDFELLPNLDGAFCTRQVLKVGKNIEEEYLPIAKNLIPDTISNLINPAFILELKYESFSRNDLFLAFSQQLQRFSTKDNHLDITNDAIKDVVSLCSIFPKVGINSTRKSIVKLICKHYSFDYEEYIVANVEDDKFDYDAMPTISLIKIVICDFINSCNEDKAYVESNLDFLKSFIRLIDGQYDYKGILKSQRIFPNQNFVLSEAADLFKESAFPDEQTDSEYLKDTYNLFIDDDIRRSLLHNDFLDSSTISKEKSAKDLASPIDSAVNSINIYDINKHKCKSAILKLIEKLTNSKFFKDLFPLLDSKKAMIMMTKISDDKVKGDLFKIIASDDEKISLLGKLSQREDLNHLISLGEKALEQEREFKSDFQFKKQIGVHIENLIRDKIGQDIHDLCIDTTADEQQGGQDIVIRFKGEIIYYIEVKSRWNSRKSIMMSPLQMKTAAENKEKYSLCSVDMCDYKIGSDSRYDVQDILDIRDRIKFINDIGCQVENLSEISNIAFRNSNEEPTLTGDYKVLVPQTIVSKGDSFEDFFECLASLISENINN